MDDRELRSEFRRALYAVTPPAPWLGARVRERLQTKRHTSWMDRLRAQPPRRRYAIAVGVAMILLAAAVAVAFLAAQLYAPVEVKNPPPEPGSASLPIETARFFNGELGLVVTNRGLLITHDGGQHWQLTLKIDWTNRPDIKFIDATHIVVVTTTSSGAQSLSATSDGGAHWQTHSIVQVGLPGTYGSVFFIDAREGWRETDSGQPKAPGGIAIYHTTDSGAHWSELWRTGASTGPQLAGLPNGLHFSDSLHGFMGVYSYDGVARLYVTRDGGRTWQIAVLAQPPGGWYSGCCTKVITSPAVTLFGNQGFLVEGDINRSAVYATSDGGQTWGNPRLLPTGTSQALFSDLETGWVTGGQNLFETRDGGASWRQLPVQMPASGYLSLDGLTISDTQSLWGLVYGSRPGIPDSACYQAPDGASCSFVIRSIDGGATWTFVKLPAG